MNTTEHWVYILHCNNGAYYTGYTIDLERRYQEHVVGTSKCKYTRSFKPVCIAQSWKFADKTTALKVESFIKKLSKAEKEKIILHPENLSINPSLDLQQ